MSAPAPRAKVRDKVRRYRQRLRDQGMRPIQIWVPDVRAAAFGNAARRQSRAVAASLHAADDQAFIDSLSDEA
ncbi:MAG TPA: antitoxin MazE family protein [Sphingomicrobium sp.]|nr:antitoxin MazE family protein [Sphingomicrobium sp.]